MKLPQSASIFSILLLSAAPAFSQPPRSDADLAAWVSRRVREWQPTRDERRFDDIAWVDGIREALRLAKAHGRPVFLFTHDGHMDVGRC
jgi:hypothetical protein